MIYFFIPIDFSTLSLPYHELSLSFPSFPGVVNMKSSPERTLSNSSRNRLSLKKGALFSMLKAILFALASAKYCLARSSASESSPLMPRNVTTFLLMYS